ncbi:MAG: ribosome biogenesis GTPase Der [Planctomycetes bacterium]|nr:ribosome biogenesis GTPase Der [Planctomycetota bacterium]
MSAPLVQPRLPRVAIVGRPNVGKSTLLNRLCGSRVSIVEPTAGVTRDRVSVPSRIPTHWGERWVEVTDTGGIGIVDRDDLGADVERQVKFAVELADLVLFVVDAREGLTPLDRAVADRLRGLGKPVLLVANKVDAKGVEWEVDGFRRLGLAEGPFSISALGGEGVRELCERMGDLLPGETSELGPPPPAMKLAVVGVRNAGKSTLINAFAGEERMIVSEIPGTTRDSVDVRFERDGRTFVAIDTAGVRKKSKMADAIEFFSDARSLKAVRRADVVVLLFDVNQPLTALDKKLARYCLDHYKPVILAANKWDLVQREHERQEFIDYVRAELTGMAHAPLLFLSAKHGRGVSEILRLADELWDESQVRVPTGELNRILGRAAESRSPSSLGHRVRIYYTTQVEGTPPTFVLFCNDKDLINKDYIRYLTNRLRDELPFKRVPLHIILRDRERNDEDER